tara:strand:- start:4387 stop:4743 length:357 start_codon:yes stop_codon:yes gene_type:complete
VIADTADSLNGLAFSPDGRLYGTQLSASNLVEIDLDDGSFDIILGFDGTGLAFDASGTLSGLGYGAGGAPQNLVTIDLVAATVSVVGSTGRNRLGGVAFAPDGGLFGVDVVAARGRRR